MKDTPAISVLMPVYNAGRYVAEAVESVLAQTYIDFECLILDDGSTDGSRAILERYAARDDRIRLTSRENRGFTRTLNELLAQARGAFIARMDPDDVAEPRLLEVELHYLRRHPECVAVGCRLLMIDPDGAALCPCGHTPDHEGIDAANLRGAGGVIANAGTLYRREALQAVGGYRPEYEPAEDVDLFLRLAERGRLANVPDLLYRYRRHPGAVGCAQRQRQVAALDRAVRDARLRRGLGPPDTEAAGPPGEPSDHHRLWAWWALAGGNVATARKHAIAAFRRAPTTPESWRLLYSALRGR